jgi:hypothetical protein
VWHGKLAFASIGNGDMEWARCGVTRGLDYSVAAQRKPMPGTLAVDTWKYR